MSRMNWTRHRATSRGREAVRAAADNWYGLQRIQAKLEAKQREIDRKARLEAKARAEHERKIARLKRIWMRVKVRE
jgi:hypothetical protein